MKTTEKSSFPPKSASGKPFIIPVFIPHAGCPHCCAFCNQQTITGKLRKLPSPEEMISHIQTFLGYGRAKKNRIQISFYGGNFLGLEKEEILRFLRMGEEFIRIGAVHSLRFSTRPDTITSHTLDIIESFPVSTVEIGAQSMDDNVLKLSRRGHSASDTEKAVRLLRERGYESGLQMMVGLPGDSAESTKESGQKIAELSPDFVRIYPAVVLRNSLLARWFRDGSYSPLILEEAVRRTKELYLLFSQKNIRVIRMGLQASGDLNDDSSVLAGPWHPAFGFLVRSEIYLDRALALLSSADSGEKNIITLALHPRRISEMRGLKNRNTEIIKKSCGLQTLNIIGDESIPDGELRLL